ncbi:MAG: methionyl-tRNA formyltransferase [Cyanobacteria bacterium QS_8_64_29]|nr:MAG: methionyl-tRNA formyltransferase [Cyanobacteria bacterium QS_8_64_29]
MQVAFFGTPEFAVPSLQRLLAQPGIAVRAVVTQPDRPRGRGKQLQPPPVKELAQSHGVPVWQPQRLRDDRDTLAQLAQLQADAVTVMAYGQILPPAVLSQPRLGCVNVHASLLPRHRGASPVAWSLYNGDAETGVTTMLMEPGMDTGPILLRARTAVGLLENARELSQRLADLGADRLVETLQQLERGTLTPQPQDPAQASYAPLLRKQHYALDWSRPALAIHNQVRGFYPNSTARFRQQPLKIRATVPLAASVRSQLPTEWQSQLAQHDWPPEGAARPGEIAGTLKSLGPAVQTGDGLLLLHALQPSGKRAQSGADFANGMRPVAGERFENG